MSYINVAKNNRSEGAHSLEYKKLKPSMMPLPLSLLLPTVLALSMLLPLPLMMMMMMIMMRKQLELGLRWLEGSDLHHFGVVMAPLLPPPSPLLASAEDLARSSDSNERASGQIDRQTVS